MDLETNGWAFAIVSRPSCLACAVHLHGGAPPATAPTASSRGNLGMNSLAGAASRGGYFVVGGGVLGRALTQQFTETNKRIFGIFDDDSSVQQRSVGEVVPTETRLAPGSYRSLRVNNTSTLPQYVSAFKCKTAILAVPPASAQRLAQMCLDAGITRIINYSMADIKVPGVRVRSSHEEEQQSRFKTDFDILGVIGRGGFGSVYRAKHRIDGQHYAVKRVVLPSQEHRAVEEAESMAKLSNHPNVVRYYASWVESAQLELSESESDSGENSEEESSFGAESEDSEETEGSECGDGLSLYIQMELCEDMTLREYLQSPEAWESGALAQRSEMFRQLVGAVRHIHANGYVHKDLKPPNIFLVHDSLVPKIGDFGLAALQSGAPQEHGGTFLYVAPELEGSESPLDWRPADVYALGVVLLEMYCEFSTQMERINVISRLRSHWELPGELLLSSPVESALILAMTHPDPNQRPTADEIALSKPEPVVDANQIVWLADLFDALDFDGAGAVAGARMQALAERAAQRTGLVFVWTGEQHVMGREEFVRQMVADVPTDCYGFASIVTALQALLREDERRRWTSLSTRVQRVDECCCTN
eukprot:TRINITY_DN8093_c0_g1_i1.p1 TRINITY_DN8093_c0_g1~~TRINITY_DN8093_c0_g1_i1.p1  ORF type:complete len:591 (-),score=90.69 TRINITY_DN8093_c0_g1_i1:23-1795(-)